eukprot:scaffold9457_cov86-Cyclotella_meneghiniana.AAC.4
MMTDSSASGLTGSTCPDVCILEVAHNIKQPAIATWILSVRNTWDTFDVQSDAWDTEFFLNCLAPALREEVLHDQTADYDEHYYSAIVVAWIAMRKVFLASFQNLGVLEKMLTGFDISVYPKENVVKASHDLTAATKTLKVVHQIRSLRPQHYSSWNVQIAADVDTLTLGREIRTTLSTCVSWYRSYLQAGDWPAANDLSVSRSLATPSTFSAYSSSAERLLAEAIALMTQTSSRAGTGPSVDRPCVNCGEPTHWKKDCDKPPNYCRDNGITLSPRNRRDSSRGHTPDCRRDNGSRSVSRSCDGKRERSLSTGRSDRSRDNSRTRDNRTHADRGRNSRKLVSFSSAHNVSEVGRSYSSDDDDVPVGTAALALSPFQSDPAQSKE